MLAVTALLALGGCGLPVGIQVASIFADVISYAATEKTVGDHGLSILTEQDCAVWRGFNGEDICKDDDADADTLVAEVDAEESDEVSSLPEPVIEPAPVEAITAVEEEPYEPPQTIVISSAGVRNLAPLKEEFQETVPEITAEPAPAPIAETVEVETLNPVSAEPQEIASVVEVEPVTVNAPKNTHGGTFYVIASYYRSADAKRFAGNQHNLSTTVLSGTAKGKSVYRVAVGPVGQSERKGTWKKLRNGGYKDVWALKLRKPKIIVEVAALN